MSEKEFYLIINDSQKGPFSLEELGSNGIERTTRVFRLGAQGFVNAEEIKEINDFYFTKKRVSPRPEVRKPEPPSPAESINMQAVSEAARRERERRRQAEEERKNLEQTTFPGPAVPPIGGFSSPAVPPNPFAAEPEISEPKEWYINNNGLQQGPMTLSELKNSMLTDRTGVWRAGMSEWLSAPAVPEIAPYVAPSQIPMPPTPPITSASPMPPPIDSATPVTAEQPMTGGDTYTDDAAVYGNPNIVPVASLLLSLASIGAIGYLCYWEYLTYTPVVMVATALFLSFVSLICASSAKSLYFSDKVKKACKKSGAATAYGWSAIISALGAVGYFILIYLL